MKIKIVWFAVVFLIGFSLVSCEKDVPITVEKPDQELMSIGEFSPDADVFCDDAFDKVELKNSVVVIQNATSYNDIPTYAFRCYDMYKLSYQHIKQPNSTSCSWTSYVICAGNVANAFVRGYPVTVNQVYKVMTRCDTSKLITTLAWQANVYDSRYVRTDVFSLKKSTSTYLDVVKQMLLFLQQNKTPFVTIAKSGSYGHYVTIYSIHWKQGLTGSVIYFTDSLDPDMGSFNANVKSMDLEQFLSLMKTNSNTYYNFLRILPW